MEFETPDDGSGDDIRTAQVNNTENKSGISSKKNRPLGRPPSIPDAITLRDIADEKVSNSNVNQESALFAVSNNRKGLRSKYKASLELSRDESLVAFQKNTRFNNKSTVNSIKLNGGDVEQLREHIMSPPLASHISLSGGASTITFSEAEFLARQVRGGANHNNSLAIGEDGFGQEDSIVSLQLHEKNALLRKIEGLEHQLVNMSTYLARTNDEREKAEEKYRKNNALLDTTRKSHAKDLVDLQEKHEQEMLSIKEQHTQQMAFLAAMGPPRSQSLHDVQPSKEGAASKGRIGVSDDETSSAPQEVTRALRDQLASLRDEMKLQQERLETERKAWQLEMQSRVAAQDSQAKVDMSTLRSRVAELEDALLSRDESLAAGDAKIKSLEALCAQLEHARKGAVEENVKARADVRGIQQSLAASYRLESSQGLGLGLGTEAETAIRLNEAKSEAKIRLLVNKLDFLKAELDAEKLTTNELKTVVEEWKSRVDVCKEELRVKLLEAEEKRNAEVENVERRTSAIYEERMLDLVTLQSRLALFQGQAQEAQQESALLRQREESLRAGGLKAQAQIETLKTQTEQLLAQITSMREEQREEAERLLGKQSQEAIIRRLDNERQYLKNQVASEITHKNELQKTLAQCQQQLADAQRQWREDVDRLKEERAEEKQTTELGKQQSEQVLRQLQLEESRLSAQNKDLKEAFVKIRDQLRIEQLAIENAHATNRQLLEELDKLRQDVVRVKAEQMRVSVVSEQQISAANQGLAEVEARRLQDIAKLKEELARQYQTVSDSQKEMRQLRYGFEDERKQFTKLKGVTVLANSFKRWVHSRLASHFRVWSSNVTLISVATQFRGQVNDLVKQTITAASEEKESALRQLREELSDDFSHEKEALTKDLDDRLAVAEDSWRVETQSAISDIGKLAQRKIEERDAKWLEKIDQIRLEGQDAVAAREREKDEMVEELIKRKEAELFAAESDSLQHIELARLEAAEVESGKWAAVLDQKEAEWKTAIAKAVRDVDERCEQRMNEYVEMERQAHTIEIQELQSRHSGSLEKLVRECANEVADLKGKFHNDMLALEKRLLESQECEEAARRETKEVLETTLERMKLIEDEWAEKLVKALALNDEEHAHIVAKKLNEYAVSLEEERVRGLKLEASKWKQAMKDQERRSTAEIEALRATGHTSTVKEVREIKERLEMELQLALRKAADEWKVEKDAMQLQWEDKFAKQRDAFDVARENAVTAVETATRAAVDRDWGQRSVQLVDAAVVTTIREWQARVSEEEAKLDAKIKEMSSSRHALMAQVNKLEERCRELDQLVVELKAQHSETLHAQTQKYEKALGVTKGECKLESDAMLKELSLTHEKAISELERVSKEHVVALVQEETARLTAEMERQLVELHNESEALVADLETALAELKVSKADVAKELEETKSKLENADDSLYDIQQLLKKKDKEISLMHWRMLTYYGRYQIEQRVAAETLQLAHAQQMRTLENRYKTLCSNKVMTAMQLAHLMTNVEASRKNLYLVLVSYKSDFLSEKRMQIRIFEKDIDRLSLERDALEEQRDTVELEIEQLEAQVRDTEDQIREHNRSSAMQNGRINLAHARKKKRLDGELERLFDLIERKRLTIADLEEGAGEKARQRDAQESAMIDLEKDLVQLLVEQLKLAVGLVEDVKGVDEEAKSINRLAKLPWPVVREPVYDDALQITDIALQDLERDENMRLEEDDGVTWLKNTIQGGRR